MSSWLAGDALVEEFGMEEAERRLQKRYFNLGAEDQDEHDRVLGALGRVRMLQEEAR